jgi:hypothetical protein
LTEPAKATLYAKAALAPLPLVVPSPLPDELHDELPKVTPHLYWYPQLLRTSTLSIRVVDRKIVHFDFGIMRTPSSQFVLGRCLLGIFPD